MLKCTLDIKPLSVNEAWQGRRFKTPLYKEYESAMLLMLPKYKVEKGLIEVEMKLCTRCDIDNPIKPLLDILCKKYSFNDKDVMKLTVVKCIPRKGEREYIEVSISPIKNQKDDNYKENKERSQG